MTLFLSGIALILAGGLSAAVRRGTARETSDPWYQLLVVAGGALAAVAAVRVLVTGAPEVVTWHAAVPGGDWSLGIDALSAVFLVAVLAVGMPCAVFGAHDFLAARRAAGDEHHRSTWFAELAFAVLVAAIALVVTARTIVVFLGAWEVMAIASYVLIVTYDDVAEVRRAGLIYLVSTHTATLALFAMFATWQSGAADWSFAALAAASPSLPRGATIAILLLALGGFGFKAGLVPLHFWLPPAHAAAPSHVSALMSGVVIKTGVYGLLRVVLMLGGAPAWWGWIVLGLGVVSGVLGVLWALVQHDTKRLLAYHSVENIGIILMGIGVGVLGVAYRAPMIAVLGFAGALLHTVNHALFKSLLFLGAGAVYRATGTREIEALGGLARRMPWTWVAFAVGAAAIIGVPPFNGFVSEWLVYQGLFAAGQSPDALRLSLFGVPALALIGALALACFAKVAGIVFLGTPRTPRAAAAVEAGAGSLAPMLLLAGACTVLGIVPAIGVTLVSSAARTLAGPGAAVSDRTVAGAWTISVFALVFVGFVAALWWMRAIVMRRGHEVRHEPTWGCGYAGVTPRMQYTATSFAAPVVSLFGRLSGAHVERTATALHVHAVDPVLDGAVLPLWSVVRRAAIRLRPLQHGGGRLHVYLMYVLAALLVLLGYLLVSSRP